MYLLKEFYTEKYHAYTPYPSPIRNLCYNFQKVPHYNFNSH